MLEAACVTATVGSTAGNVPGSGLVWRSDFGEDISELLRV